MPPILTPPPQYTQRKPSHPPNGQKQPQRSQSQTRHLPGDGSRCAATFYRKLRQLGIFLGLLIFMSIMFHKSYHITERTAQSYKTEEERVSQPTRRTAKQKSVRRWAYAFFLGGLPTVNNEKDLHQANYRGLLYNILVSVQILRKSGSTADMLLLVHMAEPHAALHPGDEHMLRSMNITINYVPPTMPSYINSFATVALEKFRLLDYTQYSRILYMNADVTPHCNLDYLFHLTENGDESVLQENVIISVGDMPAWTGMFMIRPMTGHYEQFLQILGEYPSSSRFFDAQRGWGHTFEPPHDFWQSIASKRKGEWNKKWNFQGAHSDAGLLYYWTKYVRQKVSLVVGKTVYDINQNRVNQLDDPITPHMCLDKNEQRSGKGHQWYPDKEMKSLVSPFAVGPYGDFSQWEHTGVKPWNYAKAPASFQQENPYTHITSSRRHWFHTLRQIQKEYGFDFGFSRIGSLTESEERAMEDMNGAPNWKYIPRKDSPQRYPIWSKKVHALKQWQKIQTDDIAGAKAWIPPYTATARHFTEDNDESHLSCNCTKPITLDPCSNPSLKLEDWLEDRIGMRLSKHRPACPDAARNHMHVLIPFANLPVESVRAAYCSVACQNYPSDKRTIYLYDDGSDISATIVLNQLCRSRDIPFFKPSISVQGDRHDDFDMEARRIAAEYIHQYKRGNYRVADPVCIHSEEHLGPGGARYWGLRLLEANAGVNDVIMMVEGSDELYSDRGLHIINKKYEEKSAWATYGSFRGIGWAEVKDIPKRYIESADAFRPRQDKPTWRFGNARTFKAHLLRHIGQIDFIGDDHTWLLDSATADRSLFYRILELSGIDRVARIHDFIYWDNAPNRDQTIAVPEEVLEAQLKHVKSMAPSHRLNLPIHVVMLCKEFTFLLKEQLMRLQEQTLAQNRQLVIHLVSDNADASIRNEIDRSVRLFRESKPSSSFVPLEVRIVEIEKATSSFTEFNYVDNLRSSEALDYIVFVKEGQYLPQMFLVSLLQYHRARGITTWYGKVFTSRNPDTGIADFYRSDNLTMAQTALREQTDITAFTYSGRGGSVFDINLWLFESQIRQLIEYTEQSDAESDDVCMSYAIDALLGWDQRRLANPIPVDILEWAKLNGNGTGFPGVPDEIKNELQRTGLSVRHYTASGTGALFNTLQTKFKWDVLRNSAETRLEKHGPKSNPYTGPTFNAPSRTMLEGKRTKKAFVCITGQLARLELENKINNLLLPIQQEGYHVDVALVLSGGKSAFTNENVGKRADLRPKERIPFYEELPEALDVLLRYNMTVVSPHSKEYGTYFKLRDPVIHLQYLEGLYYAQKKMRTFEEQRKRAQNHPRIYESYQRCLAFAEQSVKKATAFAGTDPTMDSPTVESYYDTYIRIREDVGFEEPLSTRILRNLVNPPRGSITTTECRGWYGMNDRFAVVSPDIAKVYFDRPYRIFQRHEHLGGHIVVNPETYLLYAYTTAGINVFGMPELKGITRIYKTRDGKTDFYQEDKKLSFCPEKDFHRLHLYDLYGWTF